MARRKKNRRNRRYSSGMGAVDLTNLIGVVAGAVASKLLDKVIPDTIDNKIVAGGKIALGLALPMLVKDGKTKNMLAGVGSGMIAVGSVELLNSFGLLAGLGAKDDDMLVVSLEGADDLSTVNGDDINVVNGVGEDVLAEDVLAEDVLANAEAEYTTEEY